MFSPAALQPFQRSISGLIVSENTTIEGLNRLFVLDVRHQSRLHRLLTESPFSLDAVNDARLALLHSLPGTQMKPKGLCVSTIPYGPIMASILISTTLLKAVMCGLTTWSISMTVLITPTTPSTSVSWRP